MNVPSMYGVDQGDVDQLINIARRWEEAQRAIEIGHINANARLDDNLGDD